MRGLASQGVGLFPCLTLIMIRCKGMGIQTSIQGLQGAVRGGVSAGGGQEETVPPGGRERHRGGGLVCQ